MQVLGGHQTKYTDVLQSKRSKVTAEQRVFRYAFSFLENDHSICCKQ